MKHTQTPWKRFILDTPKEKIGAYVQGCVNKSQEENFHFILGKHPDGGDADVCHVGNGPKSSANAEFIVRAVNAHDALLEACKCLMNEAKASTGAFKVEMRYAIGNTNFNCLERRIAEAEAAIKLAEEGK